MTKKDIMRGVTTMSRKIDVADERRWLAVAKKAAYKRRIDVEQNDRRG